MASQAIGTLLAVGGIALIGLFMFGRVNATPTHWLIAALAIVGGLLIWAIGRVETAIWLSVPDRLERASFRSLLPIVIILLVVAGLIAFYFFRAEGVPAAG
jgi:uncharacterized membrane protein SirB2